MAGTQKKSTKKFEKKHLKDTLERRKAHAKVKQRNHLKDKRKAENARSRGDAQEAAGDASDDDDKKQNSFSEMNVDDFFAGGFDIADSTPDQAKNGKSKKDVTPKIGKRKRSEEQKGDEEASSGAEEDDDEAADSDASGSDGFEEHLGQLEA